LKKGAIVEGVMFRFPNETVVPSRMLIVGSIVMVKDPITGSTGAPGGKEGKSLAVKLMVSVIVAAFAGLTAPVDASANARERECAQCHAFHGPHPSCYATPSLQAIF
jgi:hypothetical protein